jgi:rubrerythrin
MKSNGKKINRTGIATSPELAKQLVRATRKSQPSAGGDAEAMATVRIAYAKKAEPLGSMPSLRSNGNGRSRMPVLIDKLGERLAFERSGVRFYDALLSKLAAFGSWEGGPTRRALEQIRNEELEHFAMLQQAIEQLGGDPTAVTPSADLQGMIGKGVGAVLADPRTRLDECLEAIATIELVDNDCWENLIDLATALGATDLARSFARAIQQEREHLRRVRRWIGAAVSQAAIGRLAQSFVDRAEQREMLVATVDAPTSNEPAPRARGRRAKTAGRRTKAARRGTGRARSTSARPKRPARRRVQRS